MSDDTVNRRSPEKHAQRRGRSIPLPAFGTQERPSIEPIHAIHRGDGGFIPFAAKDRHGKWRELGALKVGQPLIPELLDDLQRDGYFSLNTVFTTRPRPHGKRTVWKAVSPQQYPDAYIAGSSVFGLKERTTVTAYQKTHPTTGLPFAARGTGNLRWLNVCFVDIDCYKANLTVGEALGTVIDLQDAGRIPAATLFARSGRGLWVFWFLLDIMNPEAGTEEIHGAMHGAHTSQRASVRMCELYARVQGALAARLRHLGADVGALDGARVAPVPGTLKTQVDTRVEYWVQADHEKRAFGYTLHDLADALLKIPDTEHPVIRAALREPGEKNEAFSRNGQKGWRKRALNIVADLRTLIGLRGGGFAKGHRHRGAFYYALELGRSGMNGQDITAELTTVAGQCRPKLPASDVKTVVLHAAKACKEHRGGFLRHARIVEELGVTEGEASYLRHIVKRPPSEPSPTEAKQATVQARRAAIHAAIQQSDGIVPSTRDMEKILQAKGIEGNHTTIWRDYRTLGFQPDKPQGGRPKKSSLF